MRLARGFVAAALAAAGAFAGCSATDRFVAYEPAPDAGAGTFTSDAGDAAALPRLLCPANGESPCPGTLATCNVAQRCATDLATDPLHCGTCNTDCTDGTLNWGFLGLLPACVSGVCKAQCLQGADCNNSLDDGCEVDTSTDPANCGTCGNACAAGTPCIGGKCGCPGGQKAFEIDGTEVCCPNGKTPCDEATAEGSVIVCVDLQNDSQNCSMCGHDCGGAPPADAGTTCPPPPHTTYGCGGGQCGQVACLKNGADFWQDCNGDLARGCDSDGCEINIASDPNNCGGCGTKCTADQQCVDFGDGAGPICACAPGETLCASATSVDDPTPFIHCVSLDNDNLNCGACGNFCQGPVGGTNRENGNTFCTAGVCSYECQPGFADCDGIGENGCETSTTFDPNNCGGCNIHCDNDAGQPCVNGQCLMVECDAGGGTR